jgi:hypothetical protein
VLVIDDDSDLVHLIRILLVSGRNDQVRITYRGREGLTLAERDTDLFCTLGIPQTIQSMSESSCCSLRLDGSSLT